LCAASGGELIWRGEQARVVWVHDDSHPAFLRVIWNHHVQEMTDLSAAERAYLMDLVFRVEQFLRRTLRPEKINLASLGNVVPHLHWHVIPRFADDPHFPKPVWAEAVRPRLHPLDNPQQFREDLQHEFARS
jgi:diadenosine tetraphosphate (Ap4A) HIT family hydrolase